MRLLPVPLRIDIESAGKNETVQERDFSFYAAQVERLTTGLFDALPVVLDALAGQVLPARDANARPLFIHETNSCRRIAR